MNVAISKSRMTREQFFEWVQTQDLRHEFDGFEPVAMVGGTLDHNQIGLNIHFTLRTRLKGGPCRPLGPDVGVATTGDTVRYPDGLITCTKTDGTSYLVSDPVVVFEVISPTSGRTDRIVKVREYGAVSSILRYVIVESTSIGLTVLERARSNDAWIANTLVSGDLLRIPEVQIEVPVDAFYEETDLKATEAS